jgi:hypothetical protein
MKNFDICHWHIANSSTAEVTCLRRMIFDAKNELMQSRRGKDLRGKVITRIWINMHAV